MNREAWHLSLLFALAFLTIQAGLLPSTGSVQAAPQGKALIYGVVKDEATGSLLPGASVVARRGETTLTATTTDANGQYSLQVQASGNTSLNLLAYVRLLHGSSFVYAPAARALKAEPGGEYEVTLGLLPAASIVVDVENAPFVEAEDIRRYLMSITVLEAAKPTPLRLSDYIPVYGEALVERLGLYRGEAIVPADRAVRVEVTLTAYSRSADWFQHRFILDNNGQGFNLSEGEVVRVGAQREIVGSNIEAVQRGIVNAAYLIGQLDRIGVHVTLERTALAKAWQLTETAPEKADGGLIDEAYADLRESYLTVLETKKWVSQTYEDAASSALSLLPFLAFTAFALASLLFEEDLLKGVVTLAVFLALLWTLSQSYAGYRLADPTMMLTEAVASLAAIFFLAFVLPRIVKEKQRVSDVSIRGASFTTFSVAKRNLRRRRLRTILTISSMTVLVLAFIAFTSFTIGRGLTTTGVIGEGPRDGLLIRSMPAPESGSTDPFAPLNPSLVAWLRSRDSVVIASAKAENLPTVGPLGNLTSKIRKAFLIYGILGFDPALEEQVTSLSQIVKEGEYLSPNLKRPVLISVNAAERIKVRVGETLTGFGVDFTLVALFDDQAFGSFKDLDGASIGPKRSMMTDAGPVPVDCMSDQVLITDLETALRLPSVFLSRVDVVTRSIADLRSLPRTIALEKNVWVWSSIERNVEVTRVGSFFEAAGTSITVPSGILIADIAVTMLDAVYERRKEIVTLSTIGLNPSHISALFLAEACIIGVIGGGLGYILGLSSYSLMGLFQMQVEVRQKISAYWGVVALVVAVGTAVAASVAPTLKAAVLATPSLARRWQMDERPTSEGEPWVISVPVVVRREMIDSFLNLAQKRFQDLTRSQIEVVQDIKLTEYKSLQGEEKQLAFTYVQMQAAPPVLTNNELVVSKSSQNDSYAVRLYYYGSGLRVLGGGPELKKFERDARLTASFIRHIALDWSSLNSDEKIRLGAQDVRVKPEATAEARPLTVFAMPTIVHVKEEPFFTAFIIDRLKAHTGPHYERIQNLTMKDEAASDGSQTKRFAFEHIFDADTVTRSTRNELVAHKRPGSEYYLISLSTQPQAAGTEAHTARFTVAFVKDIILDWNRERKSLIGKAT